MMIFAMVISPSIYCECVFYYLFVLSYLEVERKPWAMGLRPKVAGRAEAVVNKS